MSDVAKKTEPKAAPVQTTFTKQKRASEKASQLIAKLRAQETRTLRFDPEGKLVSEERPTYLLGLPEELVPKIMTAIVDMTRQHGARQKANGQNKGTFEFEGISARLTVPQLRAVKEAAGIVERLIRRIPVMDASFKPNTTINGRPAFASPYKPYNGPQLSAVPYQGKGIVFRSSEAKTVAQTRTVNVDYGYDQRDVNRLYELLADLKTAIDVAINEANAVPQTEDDVVSDVAEHVVAYFSAQLFPGA